MNRYDMEVFVAVMMCAMRFLQYAQDIVFGDDLTKERCYDRV
jgi:hypothetical protein